jgi:hypothetical protein
MNWFSHQSQQGTPLHTLEDHFNKMTFHATYEEHSRLSPELTSFFF